MATTLTVHGRCHCGRITYEAEVDAERVGLCHCTDCQMLTGSAFRVNVPAAASDYRLLSGTPRVYVKTGASGARRRHAFCPDCGTPVSASADVDVPTSYSLRVGCLAERSQLAPTRRIWCQSALAWSLHVGDVPGIDGQ